MKIRAWGPLCALLALFAASLTGVSLQYSKPHNQAEPTKSEKRYSPNAKAITAGAAEHDGHEAKEKKAWYEAFFEKPTDTLLVLFNGLLALYTFQLYRATRGLFTETAGLREFAAEQSRDMKASISAAEKSAIAAENNVAITLATQKAKLEISRFEQQVLSGVGVLIGFTISALWKNFGNLTALGVSANFQVKFVAPGDVNNLTFVVRKQPESKDSLAPGNEVRTLPIPIRPDQAVACFQKTLRIFVHSRISYNDMIELHGPQRLISEACNEVIFDIDPNLMLLPNAGVGPFTARMLRYSGYGVVSEE